MGAWPGALPSLLLGLLLMSTPRSHSTNPGLVARITDKGLEYAAKEGLLALQRALHKITLHDITGDFKIKYIGGGSYEFYNLNIHSCELRGSALQPLPGRGLSLTISNSFIRVQGDWKMKARFLKIGGSFDLSVKGITISASLLLGSDPSGRPTVTDSSCNCQIDEVEVDSSGELGKVLKFIHNQLESKFRRMLESKICEMVEKSVTSDLQPYLQTLPVTAKIDSFMGIDYSLTEAPQVAPQMLDIMFKGEIFNLNQRSPVALLAPVMSLPEEHGHMVYFAVSDYVFNTASWVYHGAGHLNFSVTDDLIPPDFSIRLTTKSFRPFIPRMARLYPNTNMELQGAVVSAPMLTFSPGNLSLTPEIEIEAFVLLPDSLRKSVFRLGVGANVSAIFNFNTSKITGFLRPGKVQLELKESTVGKFDVQLLEALINYYIVNSLYPKVNEKLMKGFPLPMLKQTQLYDLVFQMHKNFLFLGANVQYMRD